jgi:endoglucanase
VDHRRVTVLVVVVAVVSGSIGWLLGTRSSTEDPSPQSARGEDASDDASRSDGSAAAPDRAHTTSSVQDHEDAAVEAARRFIDTYVDPDGRVVRRDQAGDTVSEGQAYALLLAAAIGDDDTVDRVWAWSAANLQRPDGLLAWHHDGEVVLDRESAPDAEIDAIRGLLLASDAPGDSREQAARQMADGLAELLVVASPAGVGLVLSPGEWAIDRQVSNPSYFSPRTVELLADRQPDGPWSELLVGSRGELDALTESGRQLPPDWSSWTDGAAIPVGGPTRDGTPRFSWDAARVPIRLAESCDPVDRGVAARWYPTLRARPDAIVRDLDGQVLTDDEHPVALVAAAASAHAADDTESRDRLLDEAEQLEQDMPSYYGAAWVALGRVLLQTDLAGSC